MKIESAFTDLEPLRYSVSPEVRARSVPRGLKVEAMHADRAEFLAAPVRRGNNEPPAVLRGMCKGLAARAHRRKAAQRAQ
jgi:hypothetical protein